MESALTVAARVRRQLKAGRPRTTRSLERHEALGRIVAEADRARQLMGEAGLIPEDIRLGLVIRTGTDILVKRLPEPEDVARFFTAVSSLVNPHFLGILWEQTDREAEAQGKPGFTLWITPFVAEPEAQEQLRALQAFFLAAGTRMAN